MNGLALGRLATELWKYIYMPWNVYIDKKQNYAGNFFVVTLYGSRT